MTHSTTRATKVLLLAGVIGIAGFAQLGIAQASTVLPATTVAETTTTAATTTTSSTTAPTTTAATTTTSSTTAPTTTAATTTTSSTVAPTTTAAATTSSTTAPASSTTVNAGATTTAAAGNAPLVSPTAPAAESGKGRVTSADGTSVEAVVASTPQGVRVCSSAPAATTTTSTVVASTVATPTTVASPFVPGALCMVLPSSTNVTIDAGKATVQAGTAVRVLASGFKANSSVEVWAFSTPKLLKTFTTDASGILDGSVTMPAAIGNGTHTLQVEGTTTSGAAQAISFAVTVAGSSSSSTTPLPFTGPSTALPMLLLATITGFFGLYIRRRSI